MSEHIKRLKAEMLKEIKSDKLVMAKLHAEGVDDHVLSLNITFVYDYLLAKRSVLECQSAKKCVHADHYHNLELKVDHTFISTIPTVCPIYFASQSQMSRYIYKDYPEGSVELSIGYLPTRRQFNAFRLEMAMLIEGKREGVYVAVNHKNDLIKEAAAFLMQALRNDENVTVGVIDFPKFVRQFSSDIYNQDLLINENVEKLSNIDYLVIDGIGLEETNALIRDKILFPLLKGRTDGNKKTVYISDLTLAELGRLYDNTNRNVRVKQIVNLISNSIEREVHVNVAVI